MPPEVDEWTVLRMDEMDPYFAENRNFCREKSGPGPGLSAGWICTRKVGHTGLHVASSGRERACFSWNGTPREMQLPEGF